MQYKNHVTMILAAITFVLFAGTTIEILGAMPSSTGMAVNVVGSESGMEEQLLRYCAWTSSGNETCDTTCASNICIPITEMCDDNNSTQCYCCGVPR